jgi:hypothetical protein
MSNRSAFIFILSFLVLGGAVVAGLSFVVPSSDGLVATTQASSPAKRLLPYGETLSFDIVKQFNPTGRTTAYPTATKQDAAINIAELVPVKTPAANGGQ